MDESDNDDHLSDKQPPTLELGSRYHRDRHVQARDGPIYRNYGLVSQIPILFAALEVPAH